MNNRILNDLIGRNVKVELFNTVGSYSGTLKEADGDWIVLDTWKGRRILSLRWVCVIRPEE